MNVSRLPLRSLPLALVAALLPALADRPALGEPSRPEPTVAYIAGNIPLSQVLETLFTQAGRTYRSEGTVPTASVTLGLSNVPLSTAVKNLATEAKALVEIRIVDDVYVLKWKALETPKALPPIPIMPPPLQPGMPEGPPAIPIPDFPRDPKGVAIVPMVFPVVGPVTWSDTWGAARDGGRRRHQGQDLMAPKLRPLVAAFDGVVTLGSKPSHYTLYLRSDFGYTAAYMHINNDTPGTDDGLGGEEYAYAPGLKSGDRVVAGQLLAWVGDSGNAENTGPHCHFELSGPEGVFNAAPSLRAAQKLDAPAVNLPPLDTEPAPNETRWDGVIREYHPEWNLAVVDLVASGPSSKKMVAVTSPQRQWVRLGKARVSVPGLGTEPVMDGAEPPALNLSAVPLGSRVTIIGEPGPKGKAATGRLAVLHTLPVMVATRLPMTSAIPVTTTPAVPQ